MQQPCDMTRTFCDWTIHRCCSNPGCTVVHSFFSLGPSCTQQQRPTTKPASGIHTDACERTSAVLCSQGTPVYISYGKKKSPVNNFQYNSLLNSPAINGHLHFWRLNSSSGPKLVHFPRCFLPLASTLGAATIIICGASAHCPQGRCELGWGPAKPSIGPDMEESRHLSWAKPPHSPRIHAVKKNQLPKGYGPISSFETDGILAFHHLNV